MRPSAWAARAILSNSSFQVGKPALAEKPELVVFNKIDLVDPDERDALVRRTAHAIGLEMDEVVVISGATGVNLRELLERAWILLRESDEAAEDAGWRA